MILSIGFPIATLVITTSDLYNVCVLKVVYYNKLCQVQLLSQLNVLYINYKCAHIKIYTYIIHVVLKVTKLILRVILY